MRYSFLTFVILCLIFSCKNATYQVPSEDFSIRIDKVETDGMAMYIARPDYETNLIPVVIFGGSEGGLGSTKDIAEDYARAGFAAFSVAYHKHKNLDHADHYIPLEYFKTIFDWVTAQEYVGHKNVVIHGFSKGANLSLLLSTIYPEVKVSILTAPTAYNFPVDFDKGSWTFKGEILDFLPLNFSEIGLTEDSLLKQLDAVTWSLENLPEYMAKSKIPAENSFASLLLISGGDDHLLPAAQFSEEIMNDLKKANFKHDYKHLNYPKAGHSIGSINSPYSNNYAIKRGLRISSGGDMIEDKKAQNDSWPKVLQFISKNY